jgi:hypothetical protein
MAHEAAQLHFTGLPLQIVGPVDIGRLIREVDALDNTLSQQHLRHPKAAADLPKTSHLLDELASLNKIDLAEPEQRRQLQEFLQVVKSQAPLLHVSFSVDPSPAFLEKLMVWLRREIHPLVLVTVGLQPTIGAGCIIRGTNRYFDFSLRQNFTKNRELLMSKLREAA